MNRRPIRTCANTLLTMCAGESTNLGRPGRELPLHLVDRTATELSRLQCEKHAS